MSLGKSPMYVAAGLFALFFALPPLALLASSAPLPWREVLLHPMVWPAFRLSVLTTFVALAIVAVFGTPLAWLLARTDTHASRGARWVESLLELPVLMPPAVAGLALLLAFGRNGWLAGVLYPVEQAPAFSTLAVVMAQVFVAAPFYVQAATAAFRALNDEMLLVAQTLGASPLRLLIRVAIPTCMPALIAGAAMGWARALGEFGATLMFAGNLEGVSQTLPLAIYGALESDLRVAQALAVLLMVTAFALLWLVRSQRSRRREHA